MQGEDFFSGAWHAKRRHVASFHASTLGADVIHPNVVSDREVTGGGEGVMGAAAQAVVVTGVPAVGLVKEKSGQPRTETPPKKKLAAAGAGKETAAPPQKGPLGSPLRDPRSPGTVPMAVYWKACRDRDQFRHELDAARLAPEAAPRLKEELDTVKRQWDHL